jgi:hypothetical protein
LYDWQFYLACILFQWRCHFLSLASFRLTSVNQGSITRM